MNRVVTRVLTLILLASNFYLLGADKSTSLDDSIIVIKDNSIVFDLLENDEIVGDVERINIIEAPVHGKAITNSDNTISYEPLEGICEELDNLTYEVVHEGGVYTVDVYVEILCESLTFLNAFYVEKQEKDPTVFTILGVENFPQNSLYIFNDFGHEVYYSKGYSNDWNGTHNGEFLPPEKIYYYVFNDGIGQIYSGYLKLN